MTEKRASKDIHDEVLQKKKLEVDAMHKSYKSMLEKYSISLDDFSPETDKLLTEAALCQMKLDVKKLDEASVWCWNVQNKMEDQKNTLKIMELNHNISVINKAIAKTKFELEKFERELTEVKTNLDTNLNQNQTTKDRDELKRKIISYENTLSSMESKMASLKISSEIKLEAMKLQLEELTDLKTEWEQWKYKADNAELVRNAKKNIPKYNIHKLL